MPDSFDTASRKRLLLLPVSAAWLLTSACAPTAGAPAAPPAATTPHRALSIAGIRFGEGDIARSRPSIDESGMPSVQIEFTPAGAQKLQRAMRKAGIGRAMPIRVAGQEVASPILRDPAITDRVTIAGLPSFEEATAIARAIAAASDHAAE
jgi:preprotein translocase subunit SecD